MSKAILIVDMPHNMCRQCMLFQSITIFHGVTYWCGGKSLIIDNPNKIQDFCPLITEEQYIKSIYPILHDSVVRGVLSQREIAKKVGVAKVGEEE